MDRKIKLACPTCDRKLKLGDSQIGKVLSCPKCNTKFRINKSMVAEVVGRDGAVPVQQAQTASQTIANSSVGQGAFEDIDSLFSDSDIHTHGKQLETNSTRESTVANQPSQRLKSSSVLRQREKQELRKSDQRQGRNGVGLLILAAGLASLPFFAGSVAELEWLIPFLPLSALAIAFLGTFLLTLSKRRSGFGAIILALFPLVFIALAGAGGHFYSKYFAPTEIENVARQENHHADEIEKESLPANDRITIGRDTIDNNPAAKFVPDRQAQSTGDHRPSALTTRNDSSSGADVDIREPDQPSRSSPLGRGEKNSVSRSSIPSRDIEIAREPELEREFEPRRNNKKQDFAGTDKRARLLSRTEPIKALVSRGQFHGKIEPSEYSFSRVIGETTVYGVAFVINDQVRGFDFLESTNNPTLEIVTPFVDSPQFKDSQYRTDEALNLHGLNINRDSKGILGIQGIFADKFGRSELGNWIGNSPAIEGEYASVEVQNDHQLAGFVLYRDGLRTVGIGLVTRKN